MVSRAERRAVGHPGGGLGGVGLRRLRGPTLHDFQDPDAERADRRRCRLDRPAGEYRIRGLPAWRCRGRIVLRRARRPLWTRPCDGGDDPGLLGILAAHRVRPVALASPSPPVPGRAGHRRRMGDRRGARGRDIPLAVPSQRLGHFPRIERRGRRPGVGDRHDLRPSGLLAMGIPGGPGSRGAGALDPGEPSRARALEDPARRHESRGD